MSKQSTSFEIGFALGSVVREFRRALSRPGGLGLVSGNYDLAYQGNNLTITKALLNVIADGKTKVYGDADPSLTYQVSGLKNGDTAGAVLNGGGLRATEAWPSTASPMMPKRTSSISCASPTTASAMPRADVTRHS